MVDFRFLKRLFLDKQVRDRGVAHVRLFLQKQKQVPQLEMMKVWKGNFLDFFFFLFFLCCSQSFAARTVLLFLDVG
jgi:hypothetical protein